MTVNLVVSAIWFGGGCFWLASTFVARRTNRESLARHIEYVARWGDSWTLKPYRQSVVLPLAMTVMYWTVAALYVLMAFR